MKACSVFFCENNENSQPNLTFFCLPKVANVRDKWLKAIGVDKSSSPQLVRICEAHFRSKDFVPGKKVLKFHAVPLLRLGPGKSDQDGDEEMESEPEAEIIELRPAKSAAQSKDTPKTKSAAKPVQIIEPSRRPTRRAARDAAQKIHNISVKSDDTLYSPTPTPSPRQLKGRVKIGKVQQGSLSDVDLVMECHEEYLSEVQAEAMLKAQLEYNQVMKRLRMLKADNAHIIEVESHDFPVFPLQVAQKNPIQKIVPMALTTTAAKIVTLN